MNEDYLWDRSGEPDPEVQELEDILGTLRYQPRALEIPADLQVGRNRSFFRDFGPRLAIAATIAMLLLGLGIWLGLQRQQEQVAGTAKTPSVTPVPSPNQNPNSDQRAVSPGSDQKSIEPPRHASEPVVARYHKRLRNRPANIQEVAANEQEGRAAKDQLMLALRLTSLKLNIAQKKTQNINSREPVHNQHKIG